jgi:hypothetical protein
MDRPARGKLLDLLARVEELKSTDLAGAEACLQDALKLDPEDLAALQTAAHFYSRVAPNPEKARKYASACREKAAKTVAEMDELLGRKKPAARHIGGIIGPY